MKKIKYILFFVLFCVNMLLTGNVKANNKEIESFINNFSIEFEKISNMKTNEEKEKASFLLANKILDLKWIGNFILGKYRNSFDEKTKNEFIENYSKNLIKNYITFLDSYKKENYQIISIEKKKENVFGVATLVKLQDKEIKNNFRIIKKNNNYFITDIITEGVSFISAQRAEINSIISSGNFDKFLEDLKNRNKE